MGTNMLAVHTTLPFFTAGAAAACTNNRVLHHHAAPQAAATHRPRGEPVVIDNACLRPSGLQPGVHLGGVLGVRPVQTHGAHVTVCERVLQHEETAKVLCGGRLAGARYMCTASAADVGRVLYSHTGHHERLPELHGANGCRGSIQVCLPHPLWHNVVHENHVQYGRCLLLGLVRGHVQLLQQLCEGLHAAPAGVRPQMNPGAFHLPASSSNNAAAQP